MNWDIETSEQLKYSVSTELLGDVVTGPRPIIARFLRYKDVEDIISLGRRLEGTDFQMFRDLPQEIIKRRKNQ